MISILLWLKSMYCKMLSFGLISHRKSGIDPRKEILKLFLSSSTNSFIFELKSIFYATLVYKTPLPCLVSYQTLKCKVIFPYLKYFLISLCAMNWQTFKKNTLRTKKSKMIIQTIIGVLAFYAFLSRIRRITKGRELHNI